MDLDYTLNNKIKDDKFNIDELEHYCLSLLVGNEDFMISIVDIRTNQCLLLEDFQFAAATDAELLEILRQIYDEHHLLKAGFWNNIKIAFKNQKFSLVPSSLFNTNQSDKYLSLTANREEGEEALFYKHIKADCTSVFSVNSGIVAFFREVYENLKVHFLHECATFIEGVLRHDDHTNTRTMFLSFGRSYVQVMVTENKRLLFYNRFPAETPDQVLRYIMIVMSLMELDQETSKVLVWGNIDTVSEKFSILYNYIRNVSFGNKPSYVKSGYVFDALEEHNYFNLLSIYPCD